MPDNGALWDTYSLLAEWWTKHALAALVQFRHDDVLGLIGAGLGGEVDDVGFVHLLVHSVEEEVLKHNRLSKYICE